jgi:hypothetical protein
MILKRNNFNILECQWRQKVSHDALNCLSISRLKILKSKYKALKTDHE